MDKSDATGISGVVVGAGLAVAGVAFPWEMSALVRHVLFWSGAFVTIAGTMWLLHLHFLKQRRAFLRYTVHCLVGFLSVLLLVVVEWPKTGRVDVAPTTQTPAINKVVNDVGIGSLEFVGAMTEASGRSFSFLVILKNVSERLLKYNADISGETSGDFTASTKPAIDNQRGYVYPGQKITLDYNKVANFRTIEPPGSIVDEPSFGPVTATLQYDVSYGDAANAVLDHQTHEKLTIHINTGIVGIDAGEPKRVLVDSKVEQQTEK